MLRGNRLAKAYSIICFFDTRVGVTASLEAAINCTLGIFIDRLLSNRLGERSWREKWNKAVLLRQQMDWFQLM
ncbi:hypothetical protein OPV22_021560 [Ensete ventricosum]|uniref:Uncharacterized protein n=1 Tax=Ensete ventricosum TaxID=4639 RepID=A0AAV8QMQ6_ENSVE|nr:hypothetical protein OPV22_021560 [Ensete ventricosum]